MAANSPNGFGRTLVTRVGREKSPGGFLRKTTSKNSTLFLLCRYACGRPRSPSAQSSWRVRLSPRCCRPRSMRKEAEVSDPRGWLWALKDWPTLFEQMTTTAGERLRRFLALASIEAVRNAAGLSRIVRGSSLSQLARLGQSRWRVCGRLFPATSRGCGDLARHCRCGAECPQSKKETSPIKELGEAALAPIVWGGGNRE
jgi:hypothetical protein